MVSKKTLISVGSLFLVTVFATSIFLPMVLNSTKTKNESIESISVNDFFKKEEIDNLATKKEIVKYLNKNEILFKFTNYNEQYLEKNLSFDSDKIEQNVIKVFKQIIVDKTNIKEQNLFFQIRYKILNKKQLAIDIRWIDKNNFLFMYYDKNMIKLEV